MIEFIIFSLAVWRLSHMIVKEKGPLMAFTRLRAYAAQKQKRSGGFFDMISCVACLSATVAAVAALWFAESFFVWLVYTLALSAVATLLEALFSKNLDTLTSITSPTGNDKVFIGGSTAPKQRNYMVRDPNTRN